MTDISKRNIINRWDKLARADLGSLVSPAAAEIRDFFAALFDGDMGNGTYSTSSVPMYGRMAALIRGFEYNTGYNADDGLTVAFCLDMHLVGMDTMTLREFDKYLMYQEKPYSGADKCWIWYWEQMLRDEAKPTTKRSRRSRKTA